jgi:hypothetical protein
MAHATAATAHPYGRTPARSDSYARRRPEDTLLYQTIAEHWPAFSERLEQHGVLRRLVARAPVTARRRTARARAEECLERRHPRRRARAPRLARPTLCRLVLEACSARAARRGESSSCTTAGRRPTNGAHVSSRCRGQSNQQHLLPPVRRRAIRAARVDSSRPVPARARSLSEALLLRKVFDPAR